MVWSVWATHSTLLVKIMSEPMIWIVYIKPHDGQSRPWVAQDLGSPQHTTLQIEIMSSLMVWSVWTTLSALLVEILTRIS